MRSAIPQAVDRADLATPLSSEPLHLALISPLLALVGPSLRYPDNLRKATLSQDVDSETRTWRAN